MTKQWRDMISVMLDELERAGHIAPQNRFVVCDALLKALAKKGYIARAVPDQTPPPGA